jgi:hypothetical protein
MRSAKLFSLLVAGRARAPRLRASRSARKGGRRAESPAAMAGAVARSGTRRMRVCFRPPGDGRFRLRDRACLHAERACVARKCRSRNTARWRLAGGARLCRAGAGAPGHGATGGKYLEDQGGCDEADYAKSGRATADEIARRGFVRKQSFIRPDGAS